MRLNVERRRVQERSAPSCTCFHLHQISNVWENMEMETRGGGGRHTNLWDYQGSEVENGDVEKVTEAFCLVQVVYVVMVTGWGGQAKERREH